MLWGSHAQAALYYTCIVIALASAKEHTSKHKHTSSIEVTLIPDDEFFVVPVRIGESTLNLSIDTGSSDLWAFSSRLPPAQRIGHNIYKPSHHAQHLDAYNFTTSYAEGTTVRGTVYKDDIKLGDLEARNSSVQAAEDVTASFVTQTSRDGILGLGFGNINTVKPTPQLTFFETVKDQLETPLFATALRSEAQGAGTLDFGFIDHQKYMQDSLTYAPVNQSSGLWAIHLDGYTVGDLTSKQFRVETAAVDTGTSVLILPNQIVHDYYAQIPSATNDPSVNGFIFDCDDKIPDLSLKIGNYTATIPSELMIYAELGDLNGETTCYGSLQTQDDLEFSLLGHPFLKCQYVVFDMGGTRIGLGDQVF
ncbi:aspergillopepsin I [Talaromyces islandicus]|uniref:Aspergillopepsin I n=1 Tax=Talaromyces islandicus TaxID=28573 RepID=A0A0U1LPP2_TALIS|nr:aspergillopepsin I [Talaromyces islandicus]